MAPRCRKKNARSAGAAMSEHAERGLAELGDGHADDDDDDFHPQTRRGYDDDERRFCF